MGPEFFKMIDEDYEKQEKEALNAVKRSREEKVKLDARLSTAQGRFWWRIETWEKKKGSALEHHFWWFVHNCIAHPAIGVLPIKRTFDFHDYTSDKINCK